MRRDQILALLALVLVGTLVGVPCDSELPLAPQPEKGEAKPAEDANVPPAAPSGTPIDPVTLAAWERAGFHVQDDGSPETGRLPALQTGNSPPTRVDLVGLPAIRVPFRLTLSSHTTDTDLTQLVGLTDASHLVSLSLGVRVTDAGLRHLAALPNLTDLTLGGRDSRECHEVITDAGLKHLAALKRLAGLTNLEVLDLTCTYGTGAVVKHLAGLKKLSRLALGAAEVKDDGLKALAELENLTYLDLRRTNLVSETGAGHLAGQKKLATLELSTDQVNDGVVEAFAEANLLYALAPYAQNALGQPPKSSDEVARIDLRQTRVTAAGAKAIRKALPRCEIER